MWGTGVARGAWLQYGPSMAAVHWGQTAVLWFSVGLQPSLLQCCCASLCWGARCTTGFVVGWETCRGPSCETSHFLPGGRRSCMEGEGAFWQLGVLLSTKILSSSPSSFTVLQLPPQHGGCFSLAAFGWVQCRESTTASGDVKWCNRGHSSCVCVGDPFLAA